MHRDGTEHRGRAVGLRRQKPIDLLACRVVEGERAAERITSSYVLPRPILFRGAQCGEANAYYDPDTIEIIFCYELMKDYMELYAADLPDPVDPAPRPSGAGKDKGTVF